MKKVLFSILFFTLLIGTFNYEILAKSDIEQSNKNIDKFHNVEKGDILWEIANRYHVSIESVAERQELIEDDTFVKNDETKDTASNQKSEVDKVIKEVNVTATAYTAYCEGCIGITKTGVDLRANPDAKVIAVDPDIIPLGSKVYVEGFGYARAEDTGGAIKGNRIDIFIPTEEKALEYGVRDIKVQIFEE
ncbi:3D (Asp-Asp-Asp) domain-containing protein [Bacillus pakistanensis]|uniref:3D (Asp-Asp-Asp) domain-containing protein n=1 Tax=Rossellomorea pakistanensis TaxID=992288 RepID=A0ABS2N7Q3_9BACI|nr:3D (Asp-Asp-Asp) domain-containing protein [Bacillus pakistanensis]